MALKCDTCGKEFLTNASLYLHKRTHNPSLVLMAHDHSNENSDSRPADDGIGKKRPRVGAPKNDSQNDPDLRIIDSWDHIDSDEGKPPKRKPDPQDDDDLRVIDSYDAPKPKTRLRDYKAMYKKCIEDKKRVSEEFDQEIVDMNRKYNSSLTRIEREKADELTQLQIKHDEELRSLKLRHAKQQSDLEDLKNTECGEKLKKLENKCEEEIKKIHDNYRRQMADAEDDCDRKLKLLKDQIKMLQDDDSDLSSLTKAIFNCTTMEEIFEIQKLIKNYQFDIVVQKHLPTLQNLFLSLSFGILPICQPQKDMVTDTQRRLVEEIQTASSTTAKRLLKEKKREVANLFTIINDSLKLARNSYNRFAPTGL
ncbi:MAG: hypothetical protein GY816_09925 [Cytophagales bacterium]|nr:hypothetical protein [Cytophagales bacterium]